MTTVHKITLMVIDHDDVGADGIKDVIENTKYPNRCISPVEVMTESREVEWADAHPLNHRWTWRQAFAELFK